VVSVTECADAAQAPDGWWSRPSQDLRLSRAWASASRWDGDGVSLFGTTPDGPWTTLRRVGDTLGYSRMNAVDIAGGTFRGVDQDLDDIACARADHGWQLVLATTGYATSIQGADGRAADTADTADMLDALRDLAEAEQRTAFLAHIPADRTELLSALRRAGFHLGVTDCVAEIELPGSDFEDYVHSLARKARKTAARELRALDAAGAQLQTATGLAMLELVDEFAQLQGDTQRARGGDPNDSQLADDLRRTVREFGDDAVAFVVRAADGSAVAFCVALMDDEQVLPWSLGMRADAADVAGYFHVAYYGPARLGYERGRRRLLMGPGSLRPKVLRGAELRPIYSAVAPGDDSLARLLTRTDAAIRQVVADPARHVLGKRP